MESRQGRARRQLQELYILDIDNGDRRLAYYGQLRAQEKDHVTAMRETAKYFRIDTERYQEWAAANRQEV